MGDGMTVTQDNPIDASELTVYAPTVPVTEFTRVIKNAAIFASKDQTTPVIWSVQINWGEGRMRFGSTDKYRIFTEWIPTTSGGEGTVPASGKTMICLDDVNRLIKRLAASDKSERVRLTLATDDKGTEKVIVSTLNHYDDDVTATYPINQADMHNALDLDTHLDRVAWGTGKEGAVELAFNGEYFADLFKVNIGGSKITTPLRLNFVNGAASAVGFRYDLGEGGGIDGLIMPIRISSGGAFGRAQAA